MKDFRASLRAVAKNSRHDDAYIVNKALRDVAYRAMEFTGFATKADVTDDLLRENIGVKIAAHRAAALGLSKTKKGKRLNGRGWQRRIAAEFRRIVKERSANFKFRRAGWIPAVLSLGGAIRKSPKGKSQDAPPGGTKFQTGLHLGGSAAKGSGKPATVGKLSGVIINVVTDRMRGPNKAKSINEMESALKKAVLSVTQDRFVHAMSTKEKTLKKHSDK